MKEKSLQRSVGLNILYTAVMILTSLFTFPYLTRILGPEGTGKVSFAHSVVNCFLLMSRMGIPVYGVRECAKLRDDRKALSKLAAELLVISLVLDVLFLTGYILSVTFYPAFSREKELFGCFALWILMDGIGAEWLFKGLEEFAYLSWRSIIVKLIYVVSLFVFVKSRNDYGIYGLLIVLSESVPLLINALLLKKKITFSGIRGLDFRRHLKSIGVFFALSCSAVIFSNIDKVMLGMMTTDAEVGYYDVVVRIKDLLTYGISAVGMVLMSRASYYVKNGRNREFSRLIQKELYLITALGMVCVAAVELLAEPCIYILAGSEYGASVPVLRLMMPVVFFFGMANVFGAQVMVPMGCERDVLYAEGAGVVLDVLLNAWLIPAYAAVGACVATMISQVCVVLIEYAFVKRIPDFSFKAEKPMDVMMEIATDVKKVLSRQG